MLNYCLLYTTCFTYAEENFVRVTSLCYRKLITPNITAQMNKYCEKDVPTSTVKRKLCEAGIYDWIAVKKTLLRKQNNVKRLQRAKAHKNWTIKQGNKAFLTDE